MRMREFTESTEMSTRQPNPIRETPWWSPRAPDTRTPEDSDAGDILHKIMSRVIIKLIMPRKSSAPVAYGYAVLILANAKRLNEFPVPHGKDLRGENEPPAPGEKKTPTRSIQSRNAVAEARRSTPTNRSTTTPTPLMKSPRRPESPSELVVSFLRLVANRHQPTTTNSPCLWFCLV
jgi:hypothetical protein